MQLLFALICFFIHAHLFPSFATTAETVDGYNVASRINCEDPALRLTPDINKFPIPKEKAELGPNYEITLRSTNWLKQNETSKYLEQFYDGTIVVQKWTREVETNWFNRSILYEDFYRVPQQHHIEHNRTCKAINSTHSLELNALGLSSELLKLLHLDGASFGQFLDKLIQMPDPYNSTLYEAAPEMGGIEVVGWLGCIRNWTKPGLNLQVNVTFAGEHTPELPYNPNWANPIVYTIDLVFYEVTNHTISAIFDALSFNIVTLDRVHLADAEFAVTPPRGVHCSGMESIHQLPVQFPAQFTANIYTVSSSKQADEAEGDASALPKTTNKMFFYDEKARIVAYSPATFQQVKTTTDNDIGDLVIHDFVYGFQYTIAANGSCLAIAGIDPKAPDVTDLPPSNLTIAEIIGNDDDGSPILYMLNPEEAFIYGGRVEAEEFYYAGKIKSSETGEVLALYSTLRPAGKQHQQSLLTEDIGDNPLADGEENGNGQNLVELLFRLDSHGKPAEFHSISLYNGTNGSTASLERVQQIHIATDLMSPVNAWRALHSRIRPCIELMESNQMGIEPNGTADGDFYIQLANVTLNQLEHAVGFERTMSAIAEALAAAANVSQLRIVDLQLKQMPKYTGNSGSNRILTALFSIGMPVDKRIKPANTSYLREEIAVEQAAAALNASVRANRLQVKIPVEEPHKKEWNITANAFGSQSSLYPPGPSPPPAPTPPPAPSFVGYSGSALVICTAFAFILGSGMVIGTYVFYQKRQHIRGFAYQVFE